MRQLLSWALLLSWVLVAVAILATPTPADCVYCPTYRCYGPCGGPDCVCISQPGEMYGQCYGMRQVPGLLERGWRVLP